MPTLAVRLSLSRLFPALALIAACSPYTVLAQTPVTPPPFSVSSPDIADGRLVSAQVYNRAGCLGSNQSPALNWNPIPGAKAYAVSMIDPDGDDWVHWGLSDIAPEIISLAKDAGGHTTVLPEGAIQVRNDFGGADYGGPCPPPGSGAHRYVVTVYALNTARLGVSDRTEGRDFIAAARAASIATATLTATYAR